MSAMRQCLYQYCGEILSGRTPSWDRLLDTYTEITKSIVGPTVYDYLTSKGYSLLLSFYGLLIQDAELLAFELPTEYKGIQVPVEFLSRTGDELRLGYLYLPPLNVVPSMTKRMTVRSYVYSKVTDSLRRRGYTTKYVALQTAAGNTLRTIKGCRERNADNVFDALVHDVTKGKHTPRLSRHCKQCQYRFSCPAML